MKTKKLPVQKINIAHLRTKEMPNAEILKICVARNYGKWHGESQEYYSIDACVDPEGGGEIVLLESEDKQLLNLLLPIVKEIYADQCVKSNHQARRPSDDAE